MKLTQARLKELLHYDPETGLFTRLIPGGGTAKVGQIAGTISKHDGRRRIDVNAKKYLSSRLAWFYMEGYWPEYQVDHENRIRHDDRWNNLRHISQQCNVRNRNISKNNKSGITGVFWFKRDQKWAAQIKVSNKQINLGYYSDFDDAVRTRWNAEVKHGFPNCNTTSSAYLYLQSKGAS